MSNDYIKQLKEIRKHIAKGNKNKAMVTMKKTLNSKVSDKKEKLEDKKKKTIEDYKKLGWIEKRKNEESGKMEWCLVDENRKDKQGRKRNLKWFGPKQPSRDTVADAIQTVKSHKFYN